LRSRSLHRGRFSRQRGLHRHHRLPRRRRLILLSDRCSGGQRHAPALAHVDRHRSQVHIVAWIRWPEIAYVPPDELNHRWTLGILGFDAGGDVSIRVGPRNRDLTGPHARSFPAAFTVLHGTNQWYL